MNGSDSVEPAGYIFPGAVLGSFWSAQAILGAPPGAVMPPTDTVPPLPPKLRPTPQERDIGPRKRFADRAAFDADMELFKREQLARKALMAERVRAQQKARDRSLRNRPSDDGKRRVRQKWQRDSRQSKFMTPTVQMFFTIAGLNRTSGNGPAAFDRALAEWDKLLGRRAASPETRSTHLSWAQVYGREQRVADLALAGVDISDPSIQSDLATCMVYVGDKCNDRPHGKGARMSLCVDGGVVMVSCYDGQWVHGEFTGRGYVKHHNGDYEDGMFCSCVLYDGFKVAQNKVEMISRKKGEGHPTYDMLGRMGKSDAYRERVLDGTNASRFYNGLHNEGSPQLAAMDDTEFEWLSTWAEDEGRVDVEMYPTAGFCDDIITDWHASAYYQEYLHGLESSSEGN